MKVQFHPQYTQPVKVEGPTLIPYGYYGPFPGENMVIPTWVQLHHLPCPAWSDWNSSRSHCGLSGGFPIEGLQKSPRQKAHSKEFSPGKCEFRVKFLAKHKWDRISKHFHKILYCELAILPYSEFACRAHLVLTTRPSQVGCHIRKQKCSKGVSQESASSIFYSIVHLQKRASLPKPPCCYYRKFFPKRVSKHSPTWIVHNDHQPWPNLRFFPPKQLTNSIVSHGACCFCWCCLNLNWIY